MKTKDDIERLWRLHAPIMPFGAFMAGFRAAERQRRLDRNEALATFGMAAALALAVGLIILLVIGLFG